MVLMRHYARSGKTVVFRKAGWNFQMAMVFSGDTKRAFTIHSNIGLQECDKSETMCVTTIFFSHHKLLICCLSMADFSSTASALWTSVFRQARTWFS